jgi:two-component system, chemotaxis family, chemotaxis protein CheY
MALILIVDDSEAHRRQLESDLVRAGHEVLQASDGVHGLEVLDSQPAVSLIVCDVNMPRMSGLAMVEKLRQRPEQKDLPVLMLTTEADPAMKERGKASGVSAWAMKPFDPGKLCAAIDRLLARRRAP